MPLSGLTVVCEHLVLFRSAWFEQFTLGVVIFDVMLLDEINVELRNAVDELDFSP